MAAVPEGMSGAVRDEGDGSGDAIWEQSIQPVYELAPDALLGRQMVMTPWMLLDRLQVCQDVAERLRDVIRQRGLGTEHRFGFEVNPVADQLDRLSGDIRGMLTLLGRSGLWTDAVVTEGAATDGRQFHVLREPFLCRESAGERSPDPTVVPAMAASAPAAARG